MTELPRNLIYLIYMGPCIVNNILIQKSQQDAHVTEFIFIWQLLYMFRVSSPIIRSTKQL